MIITAYVGVDQWLLMVTFLPYPDRRLEPLPLLLLEQKNIMQNTEQAEGQSAGCGGNTNLQTSSLQIFPAAE